MKVIYREAVLCFSNGHCSYFKIFLLSSQLVHAIPVCFLGRLWALIAFFSFAITVQYSKKQKKAKNLSPKKQLTPNCSTFLVYFLIVVRVLMPSKQLQVVHREYFIHYCELRTCLIWTLLVAKRVSSFCLWLVSP